MVVGGDGLETGMVMFFGESGAELTDCDPLCNVAVPPRSAAGYVDVHVDHPTGGTGEYPPGLFYATACVAAGTMVTPDGTCVEVRDGLGGGRGCLDM